MEDLLGSPFPFFILNKGLTYYYSCKFLIIVLLILLILKYLFKLFLNLRMPIIFYFIYIIYFCRKTIDFLTALLYNVS